MDGQHLNKCIAMDSVLPSNPMELLFVFNKGIMMNTLDLAASYWQIPVRTCDRKYLGFTYKNNIYVFKVLPFGLSMPMTGLIRCLDKVLEVSVK